MLAPAEFAQSIADAAESLNEPDSVDDTFQAIVEVAFESVPGFDHVGVATLGETGDVKTMAFTGDLVLPLDDVQYGLREGPCSEVLQGAEPVSVSALRREHRWPRYVTRAREAGVLSQMAVKLRLAHSTLGGLNLYSTTSDAVSDDSQLRAQLIATHAAVALDHAQERESLHEDAKDGRAIGQATGILMERYEMNEDRALVLLAMAASETDAELVVAAHEVVDEANAD